MTGLNRKFLKNSIYLKTAGSLNLKKSFCKIHTSKTKADGNKSEISEKIKPESVFLSIETNLKAELNKKSISFNIERITRSNSPILRHDLFKWFTDFIEKISHRNEMEEAKSTVLDLKDQLQTIRHEKMEKETKLEEISTRLSEFSLEKSAELSYDSATLNCLRLASREHDLEEEKLLITANIKSLNIKEQTIFNEFLIAVEDSYDKEHLHSNFLKNSIFACTIITLVLASLTMYIYNFNLIKKLKEASDDIIDLKEQLHRNNNITKIPKMEESWGSYLKGYARPLYSWAWKTKKH